MNNRGARALLLALLSVLGPAAIGLSIFLLLSPALFTLVGALGKRDSSLLFGGAALLGLLGLSMALLGHRAPRGMPGRLRMLLIGYGHFGYFAALAVAGALILHIAPQLPTGAQVTLSEAALLSSAGARAALVGTASVGAVGGLIGIFSALSCWFLMPAKTRSRLFIAIDALLVLVLLWATGTPGFARPLLHALGAPPADVVGQSLRLAAQLLVSLRVAMRLLPYVLNTVELTNFRALVAARHLRAKKSGFLAAIAFLSILAVSVSSCALTTTLSVMGGFRQDLKRKILGNNAHIVLDRAQGRIPSARDPSEKVRAITGVRGVSAYVSGEVMISSSSNLSGAVLRGIDPAHIADVSELPKNMRVGSLDFLSHPEQIGSAPSTRSSTLPKVQRAATDSDVKALQGDRLTQQLEEALHESDLDELLDETQRIEARRAREAKRAASERKLPGIVVGQELARSLRLYLGDEVNIVTPLGALGPTGPMPKSRPFRVAGIFYSGMYEYDMKFAYVTIEAAQSFLNTGDELTGVEVTVDEPDRAQDIAHEIESAVSLPGLRVRAWQELNKNLFGALALEKLAMFIALGIAILVASFCVGGTLTLMVQEKGREVAVLKAMGAADRAIVGIFVLEGTMIGVFGALLGLAMGYAVCFVAENFGVNLNPEVYYIDRLPVHIDPSEFLVVGLAAVLVCLLVTIYPAQLASKLRPVDALRFE